MKLLYITAHPKTAQQSVTLKLSEGFLEAFKSKNPRAEVVQLDLYRENLRFLDETMVDDMFSGKDTVMLHYAKQFADCDKYVIAAPLWNLSFPAVLKAYLDYISQAGIMFEYTPTGSKGLLKGKKAAYITARGGSYSAPPMDALEQGERYVKTLFNFFGITDFETIACENTSVLQGDELTAQVEACIKKAREMGERF